MSTLIYFHGLYLPQALWGYPGIPGIPPGFQGYPQNSDCIQCCYLVTVKRKFYSISGKHDYTEFIDSIVDMHHTVPLKFAIPGKRQFTKNSNVRCLWMLYIILNRLTGLPLGVFGRCWPFMHHLFSDLQVNLTKIDTIRSAYNLLLLYVHCFGHQIER